VLRFDSPGDVLRNGTWQEALDDDATRASLLLDDLRALPGYLPKAYARKGPPAGRGRTRADSPAVRRSRIELVTI
jgi:hypothetical protein